MRAAFSTLLLLSLSGLPAQTAAVEPRPRSFLHRAVLDRSPVVVRARFLEQRVLEPSKVQVTTFEVLASLRGEARTRVSVAAMGERGAALPQFEKLLFLEPLSSGVLFSVVDVVDLIPGEAPDREAAVEDHLSLDAIPIGPSLDAARRRLVLQGLAGPSVFRRRLACRELEELLQSRPGVFTALDLGQLESRTSDLPTEERPRYLAALDRLRTKAAGGFQALAEAMLTDEKRRAVLDAGARYESARDETAKVAALDALALTAGRASAPFLRAVATGPEPALVERALAHLGEMADPASAALAATVLASGSARERRAAVIAMGKIGHPDSVAGLEAAMSDPELLTATMQALSRMGVPTAEAALDRLDARLAAEPELEPLRKRLASFRSKAALEAERERRAAARRRYGE